MIDNTQCPCGIAKSACEYHAPATIKSETHSISVPNEPPERLIQRLCAMGRLAGIYIDSVKVDSKVFEGLRGKFDPIAPKQPGFEVISVMTANGPCDVWRRK